jgi:hypothetical protein
LYGCCTLHYIANEHHKAIADLWGVATILAAMKEYAHDVMLQEQGCAALSILLSLGTNDSLEAFMANEGLTIVLQALMQSPDNLEIHKHGLSVLNSLGTKDNYELMLADGGLDIVISNLNSFDYNAEIAKQCCEILKTFTRLSLDFQRAVSAKGGIGELLEVAVMVLSLF